MHDYKHNGMHGYIENIDVFTASHIMRLGIMTLNITATPQSWTKLFNEEKTI